MDEMLKTWEATERSVTLTNAEWHRLRCYLLMTTKYREGERDAWASLAEERNADGEPSFPNAAGNAEYWAELIAFLDALGAKLDGVLTGER